MGHSLLNQFQGSLLGISLGLFSRWITDDIPPAQAVISHSQSLSSITVPYPPLSLISSWTNSLITQQNINWEDWQQIWQTHHHLLYNPGEPSTESSPQYEYLKEVAALPIILFLHENSQHLRQQLQTLSQFGQGQSFDTTLERLAFGKIIAELLKPEANLHQLIPNVLTQIPEETQLAEQLIQVQTLLQQQTNNTSVISALMPNSSGSLQFSSSLAIAIYCFLSTPNAFSVSVQRAMRICPNSSLTSAIVGALSGTYNGLTGIPTAWQLKLRRLTQLKLDVTSKPTVTNMIPSDRQIINQATQLFQVWAGLYSILSPNANPLTSLIVAAPLSLPD
ncbi:MAG: ADP-ribosylglycohydrolase family protein [Microcoleaceae cyanobacterium]